MGFMLRAGLVIGAIYMLSPVGGPSAPAVGDQARAVLADPARVAAAKALEACMAAPETCSRIAAGLTGTGSTAAAKAPR